MSLQGSRSPRIYICVCVCVRARRVQAVGAEGSIPLVIIRGKLHLQNKDPGNRFRMAFPCPSSGSASISLEGRQYLLSLQVFVSGKTQHICFLCLKCKSESSDMLSCT